MSLLSRGAWIEMVWCYRLCHGLFVAPLTRSVDWNIFAAENVEFICVAPLTRSVDWNKRYGRAKNGKWKGRSSHEERGLKSEVVNGAIKLINVAPLTRSVDWNTVRGGHGVLQYSRSSHEERGLKLGATDNFITLSRRSSHEERGLKSLMLSSTS